MRAITLAVAAAGPLVAAAQTGTPVGIWLTASGETRVQIEPCGTNLCGTVVWVKTPGKDSRNENARLRGRDLVGVRLLDMKPAGPREWSGSLYDHRSGRTYAGRMRLEGDAITVTGCLQGGLVCQSVAWTRSD